MDEGVLQDCVSICGCGLKFVLEIDTEKDIFVVYISKYLQQMWRLVYQCAGFISQVVQLGCTCEFRLSKCNVSRSAVGKDVSLSCQRLLLVLNDGRRKVLEAFTWVRNYQLLPNPLCHRLGGKDETGALSLSLWGTSGCRHIILSVQI